VRSFWLGSDSGTLTFHSGGTRRTGGRRPGTLAERLRRLWLCATRATLLTPGQRPGRGAMDSYISRP
jgi:hypothetical protein